MTDIEKVLTGLDHHGRGVLCIRDDTECPYNVDRQCVRAISADSVAAIRELVDENEQLRAQVHNLVLYLRYVEFSDQELFERMEATYDGLPGYEIRATENEGAV